MKSAIYLRKNSQEEATMETAKLFINGRSQSVRLPKAYRFEGNEVYIKKVAGEVFLISKNQFIDRKTGTFVRNMHIDSINTYP